MKRFLNYLVSLLILTFVYKILHTYIQSSYVPQNIKTRFGFRKETTTQMKTTLTLFRNNLSEKNTLPDFTDRNLDGKTGREVKNGTDDRIVNGVIKYTETVDETSDQTGSGKNEEEIKTTMKSNDLTDFEKSLSNKVLNISAVPTPTHRTESTAVILLTYMRSGSSLTGDILQKSPDVFYLFEPLQKADFINRHKGTLHFINGTFLSHGQYNIEHIYKETLYGWLTCDLSRVYVQYLVNPGFLSYGDKFREYLQCVRHVNIISLMMRHELFSSERFMTCIKQLEQTCKNSKVKLVKTIRTRNKVALSVFKRIPNSKILHLVRDPRATIESKRHRNACQKGITFCIAEHCDNVRKDGETLRTLKSNYPDRISTVLYEDIASNPIITAKIMYSFIGLDFTESIASYVYNITLGKNISGCKVCQQRWQLGNKPTNSTSHIAAWKNGLSANHINQTQILCKDIIKTYNYEYYMAPPPGRVV